MSESHKQLRNDVVKSEPQFRSVTMCEPPSHFDLLYEPAQERIDGTKNPIQLHSVKPPKNSDILLWKPDGRSPTVVWKVTELMPVPAFYKLERTHVRISDDVSLEVVTDRIVNAIRTEAIAAVYDSIEAKVSGETKCGSKFVLRLWSGSDNQIIAECQRESGCGFLFCEICKKVLKAAKTGIIKKKKAVTEGPNVTKPPTEKASSSSPNIIPVEDPKSLVEDSLNISRDRLTGNRVDYQLLAMDSLAQITSSPMCRSEARKIVSAECNRDILSIIISLVLYSRLDGRPPAMNKNEDEITSTIEDEHYNAMHRKALTTLANCLSTLEEFGELTSTFLMSNDATLLSENVLIALVRIVANSASNPHEAADAFKCLDLICLRSEYAQGRVSQIGGSMYLDHPPTFY